MRVAREFNALESMTETLAESPAEVRLSDSAVRRIRDLMDEEDNRGMMLRVSVSGGGSERRRSRHRPRRRDRADRRRVLGLSDRRRDRFRRGARRPLFRDQEPERRVDLRLRHLVLRLTLFLRAIGRATGPLAVP